MMERFIRTEAHLERTVGGIPSGPMALEVSNSTSASNTSASVITTWQRDSGGKKLKEDGKSRRVFIH